MNETKTLNYENGERYEGEVKDNVPNGKGIYHFYDGARYEGEYKKGLKDGQGKYYFSNGNRYEGDFKKDRREGNGTYFYANGERYEGEFREDYREGYGIFYSANGERYEGEWEEGEKNGQGVYYYANGSRYEGRFLDNQKHGDGIYYFSNGNRYEGEFACGFRWGLGTYYYINGDRYEGEFKKGLREGKGVLYSANGDVCKGTWENDNYVGKTIAQPVDNNSSKGNDAAKEEDSDKEKVIKKLQPIIEEFERKTAMPSLKLTHQFKKDIKLTDSKFGGAPYLPKGFAYPKDKGGNPLKLLAQINFSEFTQIPNFPKEGLLQFFIKPDIEYGSDDFRVIFHKNINAEASDYFPKLNEFGPKAAYDFPFEGEFALSASIENCPMTLLDYRFDREFLEIYKKHTGANDKLNSIYDLYEPESDYIADKLIIAGHRIGGYPDFAQADPRREATNNYDTLLLQIDSTGDGKEEIMWGDVGVANFFISLEKLIALDFSDVFYTWDCS